MSIFESIILGLIQGLTEFLPVSSSGHLALFQRLLGIEGDLLFFDVMLHVGTLAAVCAVFYRELGALLRRPFGKDGLLLLCATLPTVAIFLLFEFFVSDSFLDSYLGFGFLLTAVLLLLTDRLAKNKDGLPLKGVGYPSALLMGVAQGLARLPGVSRSGSTVCSALLMGVERKSAARFSFLMSIPIILGSAAFEGYKVFSSGSIGVGAWQLVLGFVFAAISGYFAIRFMLRLIQKCRFWGFSVYLGLLGLFVILNQFVFNLF